MMPFPMLIPIGLGLTGLYGIGKTISAIRKNYQASELNEFTQQLTNDESYQRVNKKTQEIANHLKRLGLVKLKAKIIIEQFIEIFNPIYHLKYADQTMQSSEYVQQKNHTNPFSFAALKTDMDNQSFLSDALTVSVREAGSILLTLYVYNGTALLASTSTGNALSTLSGVAASNATLTWLGDSTLATSGLGITRGTITTLPILLALGILLDNKVSKELKKASQQLLDVNKMVLDNQERIEKLNTIKLVTTELRSVLSSQIRTSKRLLDDVTHIINHKGYDFAGYSPQDQTTIRHTVSSIQIIKNLFDTAILNEQGQLITTTADINAIKQGIFQ